MEGGCAKAVLLAKKEKDFYQPSQSHMASLREIFGTGVDHLVCTVRPVHHMKFVQLYHEIKNKNEDEINTCVGCLT